MLVLYGLMKQVYDLGFMNSVGRFFFDDEGAGAGRRLDQMRTRADLPGGFGRVLTALFVHLGRTWSACYRYARPRGPRRIVAVTLYADALTIVPLTLIRMRERSGLSC